MLQAGPMPDWIPVGPQPEIQGASTTQLAVNLSGMVTSLAVINNAGANNGLLAGTDSGGIWWTSLAGAPSWRAVTDNLFSDKSLTRRIPASQAPIGLNHIGSIAAPPVAYFDQFAGFCTF